MTDKYLNPEFACQIHQRGGADGSSSYPGAVLGGYDPFAVQVGGDHYKRFPIQPMEYIEKNQLPFADGCVVKYITRWRYKGGLEDLRKAKHFIELLIALEERKNDNAK